MKIPKQLKHAKFCKIKKKSKAPFEKDWVNKGYSYDEIKEFFPQENYGVICGHDDIAVIDCDEEALDVTVKNMLPETFSVKTGSGGMHYYYKIPELKHKIILNAGDKHLGEIQSYGSQVVGAGSTHPSGNKYEIINNVEIKKITLKELKDVLGKFMVSNGGKDKEKKNKSLGLTPERKEEFEKIMEKDERVKKLYEGDFEGYDMSYEGEIALVCHLIGYDFNKEEIFEIMSNCDIDRWSERGISYRENTYKKALAKITKKKKILDKRLLEIINLSPLEIEKELKQIKEETDHTLTALKKQLEYLRKKKREDYDEFVENLPSKIDKRFERKDLLIHIWKEICKDHIEDDREKIALFIVLISGLLKNPKDHVSVALKGASSSGKDNEADSTLKHIPSEYWAKATRITQSEMEDRINGWKILFVNEINKNREGANTEIVETLKQAIEGGIRIFKKDNITGEPKEIEVEQKTGIYGTTETETDDELETRYMVIPVKSSIEKNKRVISSVLKKSSNPFDIAKELSKKESWIAQSIRGLNQDLDVLIPYAQELERKFKTKEGEIELFDYSKERVKRDVKRLLSLTKTITWLFQKRRDIIEIEDKRFLVSEPTDFITALKLFTPFLNLSYSGLDARHEKALNKIKELEGKYSDEIKKEFGQLTDKSNWVMRSRLQRELGIASNTTMRSYIEYLRDEKGLVKTDWSREHSEFYLVRAINTPINRLLMANTLQPLITHLQGGWQGVKWYKNKEKNTFDEILLPDKVKDLSFFEKNKQIDTPKVDTPKDQENVKKEKLNVEVQKID